MDTYLLGSLHHTEYKLLIIFMFQMPHSGRQKRLASCDSPSDEYHRSKRKRESYDHGYSDDQRR